LGNGFKITPLFYPFIDIEKNNTMELLNPTAKYIDYVFHSEMYLNCPKCRFNEALDSMYRHGCMEGKEVENVEWFLRLCKYPDARKAAIKFVAEREKITLKEFDEMNVNSYIDNLPKHIELHHKRINAWIEANTKEVWWCGSLVSRSQPSYPFRTSLS